MTRITNLNRKRTYLEAGFGKADADEAPNADLQVENNPEPGDEAEKEPKKARKRRRKAKAAGSQEGVDANETCRGDEDETQITPKRAKTEGGRIRQEKDARAAASERRRLKRQDDKLASTICLACRRKGHAVKDCPGARTALHEDESDGVGTPGKSVVGICYRCGSKRHNLSRCKKPANPKNPLPFASCFVCSGKGHLASSCPKNQGKGIYPNGGSCKLCGQTSHLAKDCELRTQETASKSAIMLGETRTEGGADEDDFHVLKRRRDAVQQEEAIVQRMTGKSVELAAKPKPKVVVFQ